MMKEYIQLLSLAIALLTEQGSYLKVEICTVDKIVNWCFFAETGELYYVNYTSDLQNFENYV